MAPTKIGSRLLAAAAVSLTFTLGLAAAIYCVADLASGSARAWMRSWEESGHLIDSSQWRIVHGRLRLANRLVPWGADRAADMGRLMEWGAWQHAPHDPRGLIFRETASRHYRMALQRRPGWGYAWAHFAENRLLSGMRDEVFLAALAKATDLAPWEPQVQRKVAWLGMLAWNDLGPRMREIVRRNTARAMTLDVHRYEIIQLAIQFEWLDELRPMLSDERQQAAYALIVGRSGRR